MSGVGVPPMERKLGAMNAGSPSRTNAGGLNASQVREMFDRVAPRYDFLNRLLSFGRDRYWRRVCAREVSGLPGPAILADVCAGTGDLALAFLAARRGSSGTRVVAVDFSAPMLNLGRAKTAGRKGRGVLFARADSLALPLRDDAADAAGIAFGLRNLVDLDAALKELARIVRPGGKVLILEFTRPAGRFFGPLFRGYFHHLLPRLARWFSRAAGEAYDYLPRSVDALAGPEELRARLCAAGLAEVRAAPLTFGVVNLYVGVKQAGASTG